jgi:hypothetical protein
MQARGLGARNLVATAPIGQGAAGGVGTAGVEATPARRGRGGGGLAPTQGEDDWLRWGRWQWVAAVGGGREDREISLWYQVGE